MWDLRRHLHGRACCGCKRGFLGCPSVVMAACTRELISPDIGGTIPERTPRWPADVALVPARPTCSVV